MKTIVIAGGCFWGVQAYYAQLDGVLETEVGYANGKTENPTYEDVCSHLTGHAEVVIVKYDPEIISLEDLLERFFRIVDPTAWNRQGPDMETSTVMASILLTQKTKLLLMLYRQTKSQKYSDLIVTEVEPLKAYYKAEEYHQDYLKKNPNGYCHINLNA